MRYKNILPAAGVCLTLLLTACGGGGAGTSTSGDLQFSAPQEDAPATGLDRFLLFPNPQLRADGVFEGVFEVGAPEYAKAYYEAIDPTTPKTHSPSGKPPTTSVSLALAMPNTRSLLATSATSATVAA